MFEQRKINQNKRDYILEDGVICTTILVSMHGNANSGKAYYACVHVHINSVNLFYTKGCFKRNAFVKSNSIY